MLTKIRNYLDIQSEDPFDTSLGESTLHLPIGQQDESKDSVHYVPHSSHEGCSFPLQGEVEVIALCSNSH